MSMSKLPENLLIWAGLWLAPLVWAANMQLGQILPYADCRASLHPSAVVSFAGAVVAALSGLVSWRRSRRPAHHGGVPDSTICFGGTVSALSACLFTFALLLQGIASMVLTGCEK